MDNKKPSLVSQSGRRKSGGSTQLRSPIVKRPSAAPVSLQGWLHKQGSEGLMLWKKRWFVLSEYCLFYYKGPEEEKLLGSILLPSYKVSPCTAEDKIYRKFAFKAEHVNMRTYYFAAETRELMTRWMNALSLATILQEGTKLQSNASWSPSLKRNLEEDNSSFQEYHARSGPITVQPTSQDGVLEEKLEDSNRWLPKRLKNPYQPLYANAPPKPKRLNNEGQLVGSSPEASPTRREDSENMFYCDHRRFPDASYPNRSLECHYHSYKCDYVPGTVQNPDIVHSVSHFGSYSGTPDQKASDSLRKSNMNSSNFIERLPLKEGDQSEYLDAFKDKSYNVETYPKSGERYFEEYEKPINQSTDSRQISNQYHQSYQQAPATSSRIYFQDLDRTRNVLGNRNYQPPRPHSADFLDFDAKKYPNKKHQEVNIVEKCVSNADQKYCVRPPRPKSSLEVMHANDGYYWSEERYAEKMRQSALIFQSTIPQKSQSSRANTPNLKQFSDTNRTIVEQKYAKSEQVPVVLRQKKEENVGEAIHCRRWSEHEDRTNNPFVRSASARLPNQKEVDDESDEVQGYTGGEDFSEGRKEESMKRLLEWKQRMLQSPLTRKSSGSSMRGIAQNELSKYYKKHALMELERQEAKNREDLWKKRAKPDGMRNQNRNSNGRNGISAMLSSDRYYSYSSDDEENTETSSGRIRKSTQFGKFRKGNEEMRRKKTVHEAGEIINYTSPDYENIEHDLSAKFSKSPYEVENNGKFNLAENEKNTSSDRVKMENNTVQSKNNIEYVSRECTDGNVPNQSEVYTELSLTNMPESRDLQNESEKTNWKEKMDETKLIKEFSYQYIREGNPSDQHNLDNCKILDVPPENIVKSRIKQLGLEEQEADGKEASMKEPLKMSFPVNCLNEAQVSNLKNVNSKLLKKRKSINKLMLGEAEKQPSESLIKIDFENKKKSVKDLLADFEKKSQLFQKKESSKKEKIFEEVPGKRYVFSDTETLLYDTSSDTEYKKEESYPSVSNSFRKSEYRKNATGELTEEEEEDGDEEVAATLGRRDRVFSFCRDLGQKRDSDGFHCKRLLKSGNAVIKPSPSSDVETNTEPGYLRSSLSDSVAMLENSDSTCSTPTIEKIKDNLEKNLPKENLMKSDNVDLKNGENCEGHYMPMTPLRRISAPPSDKSRSNSSLHSFLFAVDPEETYVEMTENSVATPYLSETNKPSLSNFRKSYLDYHNPGYCEITKNDSESHYDFLYRSSSMKEPEYMEVNTLLEILKEQDERLREHKDAVEDKLGEKQEIKGSQLPVPPTPPRSALPDILNSSTTSQPNIKSDSSDADDESSKELDSLDVPRHPRFSLSDTFRPASYYLGSIINERNRNIIRLPNSNENHDSSDSDLVSPPPIPTSPLLLDDLDTSLETDKSLELKCPNVKSAKMEEKEVIRKLWNKSLFTNHSAESDDETRKKKRRPVSEDILETLQESERSFSDKPLAFSELDSIGSRNGLVLDEECGGVNLDDYLEELKLSNNANVHMYSKGCNENIYKSCPKEIDKNLMPKESVKKGDSSEKSLLKLKYCEDNCNVNEVESADQNKAEVQYENLQALFPPPPPELYDSSNDQSDRESNLFFYRNDIFPKVPPPDNYCDVPDLTEKSKSTKVCFDPDTLQHQSSSKTCGKAIGVSENQGAPYYYSDIIKNDEEDMEIDSDRNLIAVRGHLGNNRCQTLNNQRDDVQDPTLCAKRNDIGKKVNPISQNHPIQTNNSNSNLDDVKKITAELRTTSAHFMGAADKAGSVDMRNIYESDTLQRRKNTGPLDSVHSRTPDVHHHQGVARNLYPQGLKDKSAEFNISLPSYSKDREFLVVQTRARSRSLEGLLNDLEFSSESNTNRRSVEQNSNCLVHPNVISELQKEQDNYNKMQSSEGDDLWEKDALWRANLRKVSLRHTRSLDNLDDNATSSGNSGLTNRNTGAENLESGRRSVDHFTERRSKLLSADRRNDLNYTRPKLSREVSYVNDPVRRNRNVDFDRECKQDQRDDNSKTKKRESEVQTVVELSDSDVLDCDDGVHYEKLTRVRMPDSSRNYPGENPHRWDHEISDPSLEGYKKLRKQAREGSDPLPFSAQPFCENVLLEPLDREKLRQWDLMSSGTVGQEVDQKKVGISEHQDTGEKGVKVSSDSKTDHRQAAKTQSPPHDFVQSSEASGSGSVIRDPSFSLPSTNISQPVHIVQGNPLQVSPPVLAEGQSLLDQRLEQTGQIIDNFSEKIDYYDRGKTMYTASNNFKEWNDLYAERREDLSGGEDAINNCNERGRSISENDFYIEHHLDSGDCPGYIRNCDTLPVVKNSFLMHSSNNLQNTSLGRNVQTLDPRYSVTDNVIKRKTSSNPWSLDVSAGELLGRTHEELVLLLIQLRRQSASVCKAMETCHIEIEEQARMAALDTPKRMEHIRKLEKLKKHLLELEKQYEKGKPLVNLVDNMVKLGSLYRGNSQISNCNSGFESGSNVKEKLEFNQKVQEQRLLAEERRDWDRLSPDHGQLQAKVQQLYKLDRLLQEESGTLQSLQQDKELLEKALGGLRHKIQVNRSNPAEADRCRKQQKLLEKELSRVRLLLAHNSKKLEETVAENARLEQELVILRQKLQASRVSSRSSVPLIPESTTLSTTAALEAELRRVQQLVGDLQRQRHELSAQVKQLTEKSDTLVQEIRPGPTGVAGAGPIPGKKKSNSTWLETDLDLLLTRDVGIESPRTSPPHQQQPSLNSCGSRSTTPIYINTDISKKDFAVSPEEPISPAKFNSSSSVEETQSKSYCTPMELSEADERMKRYYGIIPREKQEIKTVRIVKRESERRQRDRDRSGNIGIPIGNTTLAKRVSVLEGNDNCGLGRVEEESYENYAHSPCLNENIEDYQTQKHSDYRLQDGNMDPCLKFHPTNPFFPQNVSVNTENPSMKDKNLTPLNTQKSMSLPRGFGKSNCLQTNKYDEDSTLSVNTSKRNRVRFDNENLEANQTENTPYNVKNESSNKIHDSNTSSQEEHPNTRYTLRNNTVNQEPYSTDEVFCSTKELLSNLEQAEQKTMQSKCFGAPKLLTAREKLFGLNFSNEESSPQLSPVYQSEAAKEIIMEMSNHPTRSNTNRRQIRKEKRRHHTVSNIRHVIENDNHFSRMGLARSRDDLDMERALRPRMNAPDVVRSTMNHKDLKYNENTIDNILGTPNKIIIPERYIPEQEPALTAEEQMQRFRKAESIRKMLSETAALSAPELRGDLEEGRKSFTLRKKVEEEKKQREHLLELNQILAQQVMEKSKLVAVKAMAALPLEKSDGSFDEDDLSPDQPLPLYQQRENFFS